MPLLACPPVHPLSWHGQICVGPLKQQENITMEPRPWWWSRRFIYHYKSVGDIDGQFLSGILRTGYNILPTISDIEPRLQGVSACDGNPMAHLSPFWILPRRSIRIRKDDGEPRGLLDSRAEDHYIRLFLCLFLFQCIAQGNTFFFIIVV